MDVSRATTGDNFGRIMQVPRKGAKICYITGTGCFSDRRDVRVPEAPGLIAGRATVFGLFLPHLAFPRRLGSIHPPSSVAPPFYPSFNTLSFSPACPCLLLPYDHHGRCLLSTPGTVPLIDPSLHQQTNRLATAHRL